LMGTPVRGTWIALAGVATLGLWSTSSWQLIPRSRFLDELAQGPLPTTTEVHTIAAARDWVVPIETTRLAGANATTVPLGHSSLVVSEDVYKRLVALLRREVHVRPDEANDASAGSDKAESAAMGEQHSDHEGT
jgi:triacylglycerol lipase